MKSRNLYIALSLSLLLLSSCEEWLSVTPKSRIESSELFESEAGFRDALWGVYTQMAASGEYGKELTFGTVDVIGQVYYNAGTASSPYTYLKNYQYTQSTAEDIINSIWKNMYNTIANVNNLVENLEVADVSMFAADHYNVLLGEALGLRAFLHFDVLRLFAPSYLVGAEQPAIPYVTQYTFRITSRSSVSEVIDLALDDLKRASELLKTSDPIHTGKTVEEDDVLLIHRYFHLNYYAIKALMARIYMYKGDLVNAGICSKEIINSEKFRWTSVDNIAVINATTRDRTFSNEQIFALQVQNMVDNINSVLTETIYNTSRFVFNNAFLNNRWPTGTHATDWRRLYFWSDVIAGTSDYRFCNKLWQPESMPVEYAKRMPLIRLPEMYLIAAESDIANAASFLDVIRKNRGIQEAVSYTTEADLQKEIQREYLREFVCEGVVFFYYKRLNAVSVDGFTGSFKSDNYVLPIPKEEIELNF
jgi:hypothetical protein